MSKYTIKWGMRGKGLKMESGHLTKEAIMIMLDTILDDMGIGNEVKIKKEE